MKWFFIGLLVFVHILLLSWNAIRHSPVSDEMPHVVSGLSHWQTGDFSLYRVNPPLARMVASLPIYLTEPNQNRWLPKYIDPGDFGRTEFYVAELFIDMLGTDFFRWIVIARLTSIAFSVLGLVVCYIWASELYGNAAGFLAAWMWSISPMVLAFGAIVTPDVPSAAMGVLSLYWIARWLKSRLLYDAALAGIGIGLAELTKSTWIILPPLVLFFWFLKDICFPIRIGRFVIDMLLGLPQLILVFTLACIIVLVGYGFQGAFQHLGDYGFQSKLLRGEIPGNMPGTVGNRFDGTWCEDIPLPLPKQFVLGFDYHKADVEPGNKLAYLRGELRDSGWWYYYLFALAIKCTLGGLGLFCIASGYRFSRFRRWPILEEWVLLMPLLLILVLLSYHTGLNKHSRYLLPIFPLAIIWSSQCATAFTRRPTRSCVVALAVFSMASSLACYPHSMSYFNESIGGPKNGQFYLLNSNVDWGQDLFFLKTEIKRRDWSTAGIVCSASYDARVLGLEYFLPPTDPRLSKQAWEIVENSGFPPALQAGQYAISLNAVHGYPRPYSDGRGGWRGDVKNGYRYFQEFKPIGMIGYSMLLYDISAEDIARSRTWGVGTANSDHSVQSSQQRSLTQ